MTEAQRRRTRARKPHGISYPLALEKYYARNIAKYNLGFVEKALPVIKPYLVTYARKDSAESDLDSVMAQLEAELELYYGYTYAASVGLGQLLTSIAENVFGKNSAFFQEEIKVFTGGQSVPMNYSWWGEARTFWEKENYRLIKSMGTDYITKLNSIVVTGIQSGATYEDLLASIENLTNDLTGFKARRLARDQMGKLNGVIAQKQQMSIGMETYYWHTMGDEKVRGDPTGKYPKAIPQHYYIDNMLCSWNNPSVYSEDLGTTWKSRPSSWVQTHPGFSWQCRCMSYGSWNYMVADIDKEIEGWK